MEEQIRLINEDETEDKISIWLYNRGVIGIIRLAFDLSFNNISKVGKKVYKEIFAYEVKNEKQKICSIRYPRES